MDHHNLIQDLKDYLSTWAPRPFLVLDDMSSPLMTINGFVVEARSVNVEGITASQVAEEIRKIADWAAFYGYDPDKHVLRFAAGFWHKIGISAVSNGSQP